MSDFAVVTVKPRGAPCQRSRCSRWVQASNTRRRGASKTRVITSVGSAICVAGSVFAAMFLLLGLKLFQVIVQTVQTLVPETAAVVHPISVSVHPPGPWRGPPPRGR